MHTANTERIITQILRSPELFAMATWVEPSWDDTGDIDPCGTTCCIAGWAHLDQLLDEQVDYIDAVLRLERNERRGSFSFNDAGVEYLDLPLRGGHTTYVPLFYAEQWPKHYRELADEVPEAVAAASLLRDMLDGTVLVQRGEGFDEMTYDWDVAPDDEWWLQFTPEGT